MSETMSEPKTKEARMYQRLCLLAEVGCDLVIPAKQWLETVTRLIRLEEVAEAALKMIDGHSALREAGLLARPTEAAEQLIDMVKRELEGCLNDERAESEK